MILLLETLPVLGTTTTIAPLGLLPDGSYPAVTALSGDGSTVVGTALSSAGESTAFRWTAQHGFQLLQHLPNGSKSRACSVSFDGQVVVGGSTDAPAPHAPLNATRWAADGSVQIVSGHVQTPFALATDISNQGTVVGLRFRSSQSGTDTFEGFSWQLMNGPNELTMSAITPTGDEVRAISLDDSHVFGNPYGASGFENTVVWTDFANPTTNAPGYFSDAANNGMAVGQGRDLNSGHWKPFIHDADGVSSLLPVLSSDIDRSFIMTGISADGSRIVGNSVGGYDEPWPICQNVGYRNSHLSSKPVVWTSWNEVFYLGDYLSLNGIETSQWVFSTAVDISDDGLTIIGEGYHQGVYQPFLVTIPEPSTVTSLIMGMMLIWSHRDRKAEQSASRRPIMGAGRPGITHKADDICGEPVGQLDSDCGSPFDK